MVRIRLRRIGTKARPFYRMVVAQSTSGRNGSFVETIGTYNPVAKPTHLKVNEDRALHWLMEGAQPSETTAYLLNKVGVLEKYFEARPKAKAKYGFLDKRTSAMRAQSVIEVPAVAEKPAKAKAVAAEAEVVAEPETPAEPEPTPEEAPEQEVPVATDGSEAEVADVAEAAETEEA